MDPVTQNFTLKIPPRFSRKLIKWLLAGLAVITAIALLPAVQSVIGITVIALFLSLILEPLVNFLENHGIQRLLAAVLVFAAIIFLGITGFKFLAPVVAHEIKAISEGIDDKSPGDVMQKVTDKLGDDIPILSNPMVQTEIKTKIDEAIRRSFTMVVDLLSAVFSFVMLAFITFFFLKDGRRMKKAIISWVPNRYFEMALIIIHKINEQLGKYIRGQLLVALIVGAMSIFALYLLGIRYYFFIGAMAGLANMIPYFGPVVGAAPAIIIALLDTGSVGSIAAIAVAFASIQLFENVFVSPFIVSKSVELHPLTVILVILVGGQLLGIFGMLLAVPAASIVKVSARELIWGFKHYRIFG